MKHVFGTLILCACSSLAAPTLYSSFGAMNNTPDGMALSPDGSALFLTAPNLQSADFPGMIWKQDLKSGAWSIFSPALLHPQTGAAVPMGIAFGPDGNLYYCDNQYWRNKNHKSRIMRIRLARDGSPEKIEPVVENAKFANGMRFRGDDLFFTDTNFDLPGKPGGGIYRIPVKAFAERPVRLLPKTMSDKDPYLLGFIPTKVLQGRGGDNSGPDGLAFSPNGDLYTGTFSSGSFYKFQRQVDGSYAKPELIFDDPKRFPCCDGIAWSETLKCLVMADSASNAIRTWDPAKEGTGSDPFGTLWENEDTMGETGLLDQPCEPIEVGNKLIVANFDLRSPGLKNTFNDPIHTLSVFNLK